MSPLRLIANGRTIPELSEDELIMEAEDRAIAEARLRAVGEYVPALGEVRLPDGVGDWIEGLLDGSAT